MTFNSLNEDVMATIADFLDLKTFYQFSLVAKSTHSASKRHSVKTLLLREAMQAALAVDKKTQVDGAREELKNRKGLLRLVSGSGTSYLKPCAVKKLSKLKKPEKKEREVKAVKLNVLKIVVHHPDMRNLGLGYDQIIEALLLRCIENRFVQAVRLLLELKSGVEVEDMDERDNYCISKTVIDELIADSVLNATTQLIFFPLLVSHLAVRRLDLVDVQLLQRCLKLTLDAGDLESYSTVLAQIAKYEPNQQRVNDIIEVSLHTCADNGHTELALELVKMFQLRVRFKQVRIVEERSAQVQRSKASTISEVDEDEVTLRLQEEEEEFYEAKRVLKRTLQNILETACRMQYLELVQKLLHSKAASELDEKILCRLFKTAVGNGNEEVVLLLIKSRHITKRKICELFIDSVRRKRTESLKLLLRTGGIPRPTILIACTEAKNRHHTGILELLTSHSEI